MKVQLKCLFHDITDPEPHGKLLCIEEQKIFTPDLLTITKIREYSELTGQVLSIESLHLILLMVYRKLFFVKVERLYNN